MNIELTLNIDQISTMVMNTEHLFRYGQLTVIISNYYGTTVPALNIFH